LVQEPVDVVIVEPTVVPPEITGTFTTEGAAVTDMPLEVAIVLPAEFEAVTLHDIC
jgi:hypothetical protein